MTQVDPQVKGGSVLSPDLCLTHPFDTQIFLGIKMILYCLVSQNLHYGTNIPFPLRSSNDILLTSAVTLATGVLLLALLGDGGLLDMVLVPGKASGIAV